MADQKISELTALTGANLADVDAFAVVDTSAVQTKKITYAELKTALDTGTGFVRITGDTMTGNLSFGDNNKIILGASSDLQIYHDGSDSIIRDVGTGDLRLRGTSLAIEDSSGNEFIKCSDGGTGGTVFLKHLGAIKLATTSTGVDITGTLTADGLTVSGSSTSTFNSGSQNVVATFTSTDTEAQINLVDTTGSAQIRSRNDLRFYTNGGSTRAMDIDSSGNVGIGKVPPTDAHVTWSQLFLGEKGSYISEKSNSGGIFGNFVTDNLYIDADTGAFANITTDQSSAYRQEAGVHHWYSQASGSAGAAVTLSEKMRIDSSGKVGIGTSSPTADLHVSGSGARKIDVTDTGGVSTRLSVSGSNAFLGTTTDHSQLFITNDTERMRITDDGDVQIKDGGKLQIYRSGNGSAGELYMDTGEKLYINNTWGNKKIVLDRDGNVGINTTSPTLTGFGTGTNGLEIADATLAGIRLNGNAADSMYFVSGAGQHWLYGKGAVPMTFSTNGSEAMRIDESGNLLVGRTSVGDTGNGHSIRGGDSAVFSRDSTGETMIVARNDSQGDLIQFRRGSSVCGEIVNTGSSSVSYNTSSDYRLKENVVYDWDATTRLKQLKPARFNFISDDTNTLVDGFIAHEVSSIVPEAITGAKDEVDDNGDAVMQGIDQSKLVPLLVKTIQELEARITALEGE